jgi:hypothetical protein
VWYPVTIALFDLAYRRRKDKVAGGALTQF